MTKKSIAAAAMTVATVLAGGAAVAGGMAEPVSAPAPVVAAPDVMADTDWSGAYVGLSFGTGTADNSFDEFDLETTGLHAGYRLDRGALVLGGELAYAIQAIEGETEDQTSIRLKGIVGYDAGKFLPYAVVGVSSLAFDEETGSGLILGAGAAYKVTDSLEIGLEYTVETSDDLFDTAEVTLTDISLRASYAF